jgi:hypothetical protein
LPYLAFNIARHNYWLHHHGGFDGVYIHVNTNDQFAMIETMTIECSKVIIELFHTFPHVEIMVILGMVYP